MNVATVLDNSEPVLIMRKHRGKISVCNKKFTTSGSSTFTRAPITPRDVNRRYSNGRCLEEVFRKGYKYSWMLAEGKKRTQVSIYQAIERKERKIQLHEEFLPFINLDFVSECEATHCSSAKALQTRLLAFPVKVGGDNIG